jgi:hypothetical protein
VKNDDLAVATHGRSFWILDDLSPLRQWQDSLKEAEVHLFTPGSTNHTVFPASFFGGGNAGENPPGGAVISYFLKNELKKPEKKNEAAGKESAAAAAKPAAEKNEADSKDTSKPEESRIKLEILDEAGKVIRTYPPKKPAGAEPDEGFGPGREQESLPTKAGINRFVWDLHYEPALKIPNSPLWGGSTDGPLALPGKYQARLTVDGKSQTQNFEVVPDPRLKVSPEDLKKQFDLMQSILGEVTQVHTAIMQIRDVRSQVNALNKRLTAEKNTNAKALADAGAALDKKMTTVEEALIQTKAKSGQDVLNYPIRLNNLLVALGGVVSSADAAPTKQDYELFDELKKQADEELGKWNEIVKTDLASYNALAKRVEVPAVGLVAPQ